MKQHRITLSKTWLHFKTIVKHKHYVFYYCRHLGIPFQGIVHDLSKFSPTEFWNNVKYTEPGISPINVAKKKKDILLLGCIIREEINIIMYIG